MVVYPPGSDARGGGNYFEMGKNCRTTSRLEFRREITAKRITGIRGRRGTYGSDEFRERKRERIGFVMKEPPLLINKAENEKKTRAVATVEVFVSSTLSHRDYTWLKISIPPKFPIYF